MATTTTTPGRRPLKFASFDEVMPDVERLLEGHTTVGRWSLAQILRHLTMALVRVVELPPDTPVDASKFMPEGRKRAIFESGVVPEGLPAPPGVRISADGPLDERAEAEALREALARFRQAPGPFLAHRFFGELSRDEWDRLQIVHLAHHLSFAVPTNRD